MGQDDTTNKGISALTAGVIGAAVGAAGAAYFMANDENRRKINETLETLKDKGEELKVKASDTMDDARTRAQNAMDAAKGKAVQALDVAEENVNKAADQTKRKVATQRPTRTP
jgi:hypothetical protein